ncbi:MAG: hypothetical protein H7Y11_00895 [Armatimonadetes bacterium]|nr:hypothetical protein [Anaerolineae bacterium]
MNSSNTRLTNLARSPNVPFAVLLLLALTAYLLPWVLHPGISVSLGGYDLAEWVSLHIPERPLLTMLLLRLPPACIAVLCAFRWGYPRFTRAWWLALGVVLAMGIALLPPLEFFTIFRDDPNYRQQFMLALSTVGIGALGLSGMLARLHKMIIVICCLAAMIASIIGLQGTWGLFAGLRLPTQLGLGSVLFCLWMLLIIGWQAMRVRR